MKTNKPFRVASENLTEISLSLIEQGFDELDPCVSESEQDSKILIDVDRKTFYYLDTDCLEQTNKIIAHKFNTVCILVDLEEIKSWN